MKIVLLFFDKIGNTIFLIVYPSVLEKTPTKFGCDSYFFTLLEKFINYVNKIVRLHSFLTLKHFSHVAITIYYHNKYIYHYSVSLVLECL